MGKPQKVHIVVVFFATLLLFCLTACNSYKNAVVFTENTNDKYASILWGKKEYVPFCAITSSKDIGAYIGYMEGDKDSKVYKYRDYANEEWLIQSGYDCSMLYREINVENIPDGLIFEYEWND